MQVLSVDFDIGRSVKIDGQCRLFFLLFVKHLINVLGAVTYLRSIAISH